MEGKKAIYDVKTGGLSYEDIPMGEREEFYSFLAELTRIMSESKKPNTIYYWTDLNVIKGFRYRCKARKMVIRLMGEINKKPKYYFK